MSGPRGQSGRRAARRCVIKNRENSRRTARCRFASRSRTKLDYFSQPRSSSGLASVSPPLLSCFPTIKALLRERTAFSPNALPPIRPPALRPPLFGFSSDPRCFPVAAKVTRRVIRAVTRSSSAERRETCSLVLFGARRPDPPELKGLFRRPRLASDYRDSLNFDGTERKWLFTPGSPKRGN